MKQIFKLGVIKNFFIYAFGAFLLNAINLIMAPIIMRALKPDDYGFLSLITNFIEIVSTCIGLGLRQFMTIEYFHCDIIDRKKLVNEIIAIYSILMFPAFLLLVLGQDFINKFIFAGKAYSWLIIFCLLVAFLKFFSEIFYQVLQYTGESYKLVFIQVCAALIILSLNLSFLYLLGWGIFSVVAAQFASVIFVSLIAIFFYVRNFYHIQFDLSVSLSKSWWYIKRGMPFVPRVLFGWILAVGDRWILAKYATLADVGMYTAADMFGKLFQVVFIVPFTLAYIPYMMEKFAASQAIKGGAGDSSGVLCSVNGVKDKLCAIDRQNLINMCFVMASLIVLVILVFKPLLFLFKPLIFLILPGQYHEALDYVLGLLIGYIFLLGSHFASIFIQFKKCVYFTLFALLVPAVFNVFLNILLVPKFGISGCVFSTLVSYILYFLINIFYNFYIKKGLRN